VIVNFLFAHWQGLHVATVLPRADNSE
jgi:hypothetical protein